MSWRIRGNERVFVHNKMVKINTEENETVLSTYAFFKNNVRRLYQYYCPEILFEHA
jgi:hypothetical protein